MSKRRERDRAKRESAEQREERMSKRRERDRAKRESAEQREERLSKRMERDGAKRAHLHQLKLEKLNSRNKEQVSSSKFGSERG